jgi:hypothetical protein
MQKVNILSSEISWPAKCAVCCNAANKKLTASCSVVSGGIPVPFGMVVFSKIIKISYPICANHKLKAWFASGLSERNMFWLGLGFLSIFFIFTTFMRLLSKGLLEGFRVWDAAILIFSISYWMIYFWAKNNTPVKILNANNNQATLFFINHEYLKEFSEANQSVISFETKTRGRYKLF